MIYGKLKDAKLYEHLYPGFAEAFAALRTYTDATELGRHELDGERLYANVQRYESKDPSSAKLENHRRYIDVQYILSGREKILVRDTEALTLADAYNESGDYELYAVPSDSTVLEMQAGDFAVLFPGEAHAPGIRYDSETAETVGKVVVKVLVV